MQNDGVYKALYSYIFSEHVYPVTCVFFDAYLLTAKATYNGFYS